MKKASKSTTTTLAAPAPAPAKKATEKPATPKAPTKTVAPKAAAAPAVKEKPASTGATKIVAQIDVGFGNTLFVRGEGPGLSWEKGVPLDCVSDNQWSLSLSETNRPIVIKFLVNDTTWSVGEDYVVQPGSSAVLTPAF